jgi:hypothetical protein
MSESTARIIKKLSSPALVPIKKVCHYIISRIDENVDNSQRNIIQSLSERIDHIEKKVIVAIQEKEIQVNVIATSAALSDHKTEKAVSSPHDISFESWASQNMIGADIVNRPNALATSWPIDSKYGQIINRGMMEAEYLFVKDLLIDIKEKTQGVICEFGVFEGAWLKKISDMCDEIGLKRPIFGFDSFEGLPPPKENVDIAGFKEGEYAADYNSVYARLDCANRDITLLKGWFSDSFKEKKRRISKKSLLRGLTATCMDLRSNAWNF